MTKFQKLNLASYLVLVLAVVIAFTFKGNLPEMIPTKFDESGNIIKQAPLMASLFFLPVVGILTLLGLTALIKRNSDFWAKEDNQIGVALTNLGIAFLIASLYLGTLLVALNFETFFKISFFAIGFGFFFLVSAKGMTNLDRNLLYGVRTPWTLKTEENWKATHALTAKLMLVFGVLLIVTGLFTKNHLAILSFVALPLLVPTFYSYKLSRAE